MKQQENTSFALAVRCSFNLWPLDGSLERIILSGRRSARLELQGARSRARVKSSRCGLVGG